MGVIRPVGVATATQMSARLYLGSARAADQSSAARQARRARAVDSRSQRRMGEQELVERNEESVEGYGGEHETEGQGGQFPGLA
jgi:hypothetical protein